jgi:hypothetical protein
VGGALVPAILPVTGAVPTDTLLLWLLSGLLLLGLGRAAFCGLSAALERITHQDSGEMKGGKR